MKRWSGVLAPLALVLAACGGSESFAERDPEGYKACSMYAETEANTSSVVKIGGLFDVGRQARKASTKEIRDSVKALFDEEALEASGQEDDFPMVDTDALKDACSDEGFEF